MRRTSLKTANCPVARSLDLIGDWWSLLIVRDAFRGLRRFDEFCDSLGIAPTMLTKRLNALVEAGLLARQRYSEHPPRDEYVLTDMGRDFRPVLLAMMAFGNRHFPPDRTAVQIVNQKTGEPVDPVLVDPATGRRVDGPGYAVVTKELETQAQLPK